MTTSLFPDLLYSSKSKAVKGFITLSVPPWIYKYGSLKFPNIYLESSIHSKILSKDELNILEDFFILSSEEGWELSSESCRIPDNLENIRFDSMPILLKSIFSTLVS